MKAPIDGKAADEDGRDVGVAPEIVPLGQIMQGDRGSGERVVPGERAGLRVDSDEAICKAAPHILAGRGFEVAIKLGRAGVEGGAVLLIE